LVGLAVVVLVLALFVWDATHRGVDIRAASANELTSSVFIAVMAFVIAAMVWFAGLLVLGAPSWWLLHTMGIRSRWAGATWGAVLAAATVAVYTIWASLNWSQPLATLKNGVPLYVTVGVMGAVVGWVVANLAYGRGEIAR
jgi:hypothetical protein